jgi:Cu/Ag efflux protein CusF
MRQMNGHVALGSRKVARKCFFALAFAAGILATLGLAGCGGSKPAEQSSAQGAGPKRYQLEGRVVSLDPANNQLVVDHKDIPGFMMGMTMAYPVKDPNELKPLAPQDQIKADVVVNGNDMHLENIVVTKKAEAKPPASSSAPAAPPASKKNDPAL